MGKHAIIVIKNKDKYLQYYDNIWNSYLFLNCKIDNSNDTEKVLNLVESLGVNKDNISCSYIDKRTHNKFSEKDKIEKTYTHYFYKIEIENLNETLQNNEFEINNVKYKWFSYHELENNERVRKVNSDIVKFIKELNL